MHGADVFGARRCGHPRFERHAALRAVRGDVAAHLGMAGTGVVGPGDRWRSGRLPLCESIPRRCGSGVGARGACMVRKSGCRSRGCGARVHGLGGRRRGLGEACRIGLEPIPAGIPAEPVAASFVARRRAGADPLDEGAAYGIVRVRVPLGCGQKPVLAPLAAKAHRDSLVHAGRARGGRIRPHPAHRIVGGGRGYGRGRIAACFVGGDAHRVVLTCNSSFGIL